MPFGWCKNIRKISGKNFQKILEILHPIKSPKTGANLKKIGVIVIWKY